MNWNPYLTPQHIVFEPVELVNELDPSTIQFPDDLFRRPASVYVPNGMSEKQAIDAWGKGVEPRPADSPPAPQ